MIAPTSSRAVIQLGYDHHLRYEKCSGFLGSCSICLFYKEQLVASEISGRMELHICHPIFMK